MYLDKGHGRYSVSCTQNCTHHHDLFKTENTAKYKSIDKVTESTDTDEANDSPCHSQEDDSSKVFKE